MTRINKLFFLFFCLFIVCLNGKSQVVNYKIISQIELPNDSLLRVRLLGSLDVFLGDARFDLQNSKMVDQDHYSQYFDFFDMLNGVERSRKYNDSSFFKCYLKNVVLQPNGDYKIDLSYYGTSPEMEIINKLNITFLAKENNENFKFFCPFKENSEAWKSKKIGNIDFFYKEKFDKKEAKDFDRYNSSLAKKMAIKPLTFRYYNCKDIQEVYKLLGIDYDISINGEMRSGYFDQKNKLFLSGTNSFQYKHDLTHTYFALKYADSLRNWMGEEGFNICNNDYWGVPGDEIFKLLKDFIQSNQYFSPLDALKGDEYLKHPILIKYPIAAVLVRKVEKEYGFEKVLELISCGENEENFITKFVQITGIGLDKIDETIKEELKR